jgi:predicted TIM-barrel fold metal-dependent hydrolase
MFGIEDLAQRYEVLRIYNDFFVDLQEESARRLIPQAMLPVWDMDLTVKEMERLLSKGISGFTLTDQPEKIGLPDLDDPYFAPMWALANESGVPMNFHIGSGWNRAVRNDIEDVARRDLRHIGELEKSEHYWSSFGPQRRRSILATMLFMSNVRIIVNFCMSDMFDRYPNLKIVSAESGVSWLPFMLESMEYQMDENVTSPDEKSLQKRRPTEYFHDHIFASFWFETIGLVPQIIEAVGVRNIMVETDIPHPTCLFPGARHRFAQALGNLDRDVVKRILFDNAAELYGVKNPITQPA